jgi:flavin reductase (DIM6/NTAB) family NADH-FMN oxidoreductase RutF
MSQHSSAEAEPSGGLGDPIDTRAFRDTMGAFVTGVTVVTTATEDEAYGMTVSAFASLSLDPPLVLVCIGEASRGRQLIEASGVFSVNVLSAGQGHLSRLFASRDRPRGPRAFHGVPIGSGATGCPVLLGCAAHLDCRVTQVSGGGDHVVVIGEVLGLGSQPGAEPLLFARGQYHLMGAAAPPSPAVSALRVSGRGVRALPGVPSRLP